MNTMSWLILAGNIADNFKIGLGLSTLFGVCFLIGYLGHLNLTNRKSETASLKKYFIICGVMLAINMFIPSKSTIYMIAASQLTEQFIKSPNGELVSKIIIDQLKNISKDGR